MAEIYFLRMVMKKNRSTPVRKAILQILEEGDVPLSVPEIQVFLNERGLSPNKTTLYRQMETFVKNNMVEGVSLKNSVVYYEKKRKHHHHFVCSICESITCIQDDDVERAIKNMERSLKREGFFVKNHHFFFEGRCQKCIF
jgi:Fur family ferric uptake transcriptional regulator